MATKMKMAKTYSFMDEDTMVTLNAGDIVEGAMLKKVREGHKDFLVPVYDDLEEEDDEGRIKGAKLTEPEKPAKPKDEDPKDPDKPKK
jgi:hypothetical protein